MTLLEKYFIDPPLKNVFFILRGIYRERKKIIMKKVIRLTESEFISLVKKVINESTNGNVNEQMANLAAAAKPVLQQGVEPSWLKYPKQQYMSIQPKLKMANPKIVLTAQNACYSSMMDASFGFIIPQNTKFGSFFLADIPPSLKACIATLLYRSSSSKNTLIRLGSLLTEANTLGSSED